MARRRGFENHGDAPRPRIHRHAARPTVQWIAAAGIAMGCGWSEERFSAEVIPALCDAAAACAGTYDAAACEAYVRATDVSACDYDGGAAKACAAALPEARCAQQVPFDVSVLEVPVDCEAVYDCAWLDLAPIGL